MLALLWAPYLWVHTLLDLLLPVSQCSCFSRSLRSKMIHLLTVEWAALELALYLLPRLGLPSLNFGCWILWAQQIFRPALHDGLDHRDLPNAWNDICATSDLTESRACCHLQGSARRHATNLPQRRWVHWDLIHRLTPASLQRLQAFRLHICFGQSTWTEVLETLDCSYVDHAFLAHQEHFKVPAPFSGKGLFQDSSLGCTRIFLIHLDYGNASVPNEKMIWALDHELSEYLNLC